MKGRYRVLEKLGEGGMGVVYRAHDQALDRDVALKVPREHVVSDPAARARLLQEARTASALNHPHICTIHEVGEDEGRPFIAMEFVEGQPLDTVIGGTALPVDRVIRYGIQVADAVEHAHRRGIVHRDLKASNVMITPDGRAKILDFGLARPLERESTEATRAALKAVDLDDSFAEAHVALGWTRLFYDWDWAGAETELQRAVQLNPGIGATHYAYGVYLAQMGRLEEAKVRLQRARQLDPLSLQINGALGTTLLRMRQYDEAIAQARTDLDIEPRFAMAHWLLGLTYRQKGMSGEGIEELEQAVSLSGGAPFMKAWLAYSYAVSDRHDDARKGLAELTREAESAYVPPSSLALVYVGLGDKERAFDMLEKAYDVRDSELPLLRIWPQFEPLRTDPRYLDLLRRLNLPARPN